MTQGEIESLNALIGANIDKGLQDKYLQMVVKLGKAEARLKVHNDKLTKATGELARIRTQRDELVAEKARKNMVDTSAESC